MAQRQIFFFTNRILTVIVEETVYYTIPMGVVELVIFDYTSFEFSSFSFICCVDQGGYVHFGNKLNVVCLLTNSRQKKKKNKISIRH